MLSSSLDGCGFLKEWWQPDLANATIDVHAHFFNGRDAPAVGFLQQTFLRDPHGPVDPDMSSTAFLKLLKTILLSNTPTTKQELADVTSGTPVTPPYVIEQRDQENVASALSEYAAGAVPDFSGLRVTRTDESRILDRIAQEVGLNSVRTGLQTPRQQVSTLVAEIYAKGAPSALGTGTQKKYRHLSPFFAIDPLGRAVDPCTPRHFGSTATTIWWQYAGAGVLALVCRFYLLVQNYRNRC